MSNKSFDVFLCHNSKDKAEIREIRDKLSRMGLRPWLDESELRPGLPWQDNLEKQINKIKSAAVFIGSSGLGPWQRQEVQALLGQFVDRGCPVIPVILRSAPKEVPNLPVFLKNNTWVDFRNSMPEPLGQLYFGITGKHSFSTDGKYDYTLLQKFLKGALWKEADNETRICMLKIANRREQGYLIPESILAFPCEDLRIIDHLWGKYSKSQFGFSAQQGIWEECGRPLTDGKGWEDFGNKVHWRVSRELLRKREKQAPDWGIVGHGYWGEWLEAGYSFRGTPPKGHFPRLFALRTTTDMSGGWWGISYMTRTDIPCELFVNLFFRMDDCIM